MYLTRQNLKKHILVI